MNFVHGLPLTAISIALLINKQAVIGIIYNPVLEQLYTAKIGQRAFLNGKPIRVSGQKGTLFLEADHKGGFHFQVHSCLFLQT